MKLVIIAQKTDPLPFIVIEGFNETCHYSTKN